MNPFNKLKPRRVSSSQTEGHYLEPSQLWLQNSYGLATDRHLVKSAVGSRLNKETAAIPKAADCLPSSSMYNLSQRLLPIRATSTVIQDTSLALCLQSKRLDKDSDASDQFQERDTSAATEPACLPGDRVVFMESPLIPGVPIVHRLPSERSFNPDRLNLDRRRLMVMPLLQDESELRLLNCQHNCIRQIENLHVVSKLIFLDLFDNQLESISGLSGLASLRVLMLGKNRIRKIEGLEQLIRLDVLDLHGNEIEQVENLNHLSELRILNLASNKLTFVDNLDGLDSLMELNLQHNSIRSVCNIDILTHLHRLLLGFNDIVSFDDVISVAGCPSLQEISFRGNPLANNPVYRQIVLKNMQNLRLLDLRKLTEEEKRISTVLARKEEDRRRELHKFAVIKEKQRDRRHGKHRQLDELQDYSQLAGSSIDPTDTLEYLSESDGDRSRKDRELQATISRRYHLKKAPTTNATDAIPAEAPKTATDSSRLSTNYGSLDLSSTIATKDTLRWVETSQTMVERLTGTNIARKDALTFNGSGSLDALDRSGASHQLPAFSTSAVVFKFVNYVDIVNRALPRLTPLANLDTVILIGTGIHCLQQLNALAHLQRLEHVTVSTFGNDVTEIDIWQNYLLFRLAHCPLKTVNGVPVTTADIYGAEEMFCGLDRCLSYHWPVSGGPRSILGPTRIKRGQKKTGDAPMAKSGRGLLVYSATKPSISGADLNRYNLAAAIVSHITQAAVAAVTKKIAIEQHWPELYASIIGHLANSMLDSDISIRRNMESLISGNGGYLDTSVNAGINITKASA